MSIVKRLDISSITNLSDLIRFLNPFLSQTSNAFGNGLNIQDNWQASVVAVTFSSIANQNLVVKHGLPVTPIGYFPIQTSAACSIYNGNSLVLGATFANLKNNTAGITATILFF